MQSPCSLRRSRTSSQAKLSRGKRRFRKPPFKYLYQTKLRHPLNTSGLREGAQSKRRRKFERLLSSFQRRPQTSTPKESRLVSGKSPEGASNRESEFANQRTRDCR